MAGNLFGSAIHEVLGSQGVGSDGRFRILPYAGQQLINLQANTFRPVELGMPLGGISIATGDIDGDGLDEILTGQLGSPTTGMWNSAYIQALNIREPGAARDPNMPIDPSDVERSQVFATFGKNTKCTRSSTGAKSAEAAEARAVCIPQREHLSTV